MTALYYTLGVVLFVGAILVSIGLHELGHLVPAKLFGRKVTQYFIGFGPTVWSRKVGETEVGIKAIPLGGFVKIVGMLPPGALAEPESVEVDDHGDTLIKVRKTNTGMFTQLITDARTAEYELVKPEDTERLFYRMQWWKKVIVMAAGPLVNIAIAFVIFGGVFATYGNIADSQATTVISNVSPCVVPAAEANRVCVTSGPNADPVTPAESAGLKPGDRITAFNGTPVDDYAQLQDLIRNNDGGNAVIDFVRDGQDMTATTNTVVTPRPTSAGDTATTEVGFLGVSPTFQVTKGGLGYTLAYMGDTTVETVKALGSLPAKVWNVAEAIVGAQKRDPNGPVSIVGGGRLAGETVSTDLLPRTEKAVLLLMLIAAFNFFIGVFNFVPLLPLDGGHIVSALWEAVRRGVARVRGRPDPGHVDAAKLLPVAYVVASALLVMGVVLIIGDLVVPLAGPAG